MSEFSADQKVEDIQLGPNDTLVQIVGGPYDGWYQAIPYVKYRDTLSLNRVPGYKLLTVDFPKTADAPARQQVIALWPNLSQYPF